LQSLYKLRLSSLIKQSPLLRAGIAMSAISKALDAPLVVAASYLAYPARAVAGDLAYLFGGPTFAK
jgi:hypothetical protein